MLVDSLKLKRKKLLSTVPNKWQPILMVLSISKKVLKLLQSVYSPMLTLRELGLRR